MIIATTYFEPEDEQQTARLRRLFALWHHQVTVTNPSARIVVVTDQHIEIPMGAVETLWIDPARVFHLIRDAEEIEDAPEGHGGNPQAWDRKGALLVGALAHLKAPALYLDLDAFPAVNIESQPIQKGFFMPMENTSTKIRLPYMRESVAQRSAGIIYFGAPAAFSEIAAGYVMAFRELRRAQPAYWLLEQNAWSLTHHRLGGGVLAREWNWLPHAKGYGPNARAIINHHHGPHKWAMMER